MSQAWDQFYQLSVAITEFHTVFLPDEGKKSLVDLLQPDDGHHVGLGEGHGVSSRRSDVSTSGSVGRSKMLVEIIIETREVDVVVFVRGSFHLRVGQKTGGVELEVVSLVYHCLHIWPGGGERELSLEESKGEE